jgi:hypothetical protein
VARDSTEESLNARKSMQGDPKAAPVRRHGARNTVGGESLEAAEPDDDICSYLSCKELWDAESL